MPTLDHGYTVRAVVRSDAKAEKVRTNPVLQGMNRDAHLSFVIVPDFLVPGAFDEAVEGIDYIIHVASPLATKVPKGEDLKKWFVPPAVQGTAGVLESARKAGTVKRIVITSSILSIMPLKAVVQTMDVVTNAESRLPDMQGPFNSSFAAYSASKTEQPKFDVVHIHPSFILGRDDLADLTAYLQTIVSRMVINQDLDRMDPAFASMLNNYNNVDDTALVHVLSLDPKIDGNQSFIMSNSGQEGMEWNDTQVTIEKHHPDEVKNGVLPNTGMVKTIVGKIDNKKTEETFGFKLASYEDCVVSVIDQYLELLRKEEGGSKK